MIAKQVHSQHGSPKKLVKQLYGLANGYTETGYASCQICTAITRTTLNSVLGYWAILEKLISLFDLFTFLLKVK